MILAIDPGCAESAYVLLNENLKPIEFGKVKNEEMSSIIVSISYNNRHMKNKLVIEMVASYGMAVGQEVFETVFWAGRFWQDSLQWLYEPQKLYRKDVKMNLCYSMKANDSNIRKALIDRFGAVGTKKNPGWFYGVSKDVWAAIAVGVTYHDLHIKGAA